MFCCFQNPATTTIWRLPFPASRSGPFALAPVRRPRSAAAAACCPAAPFPASTTFLPAGLELGPARFTTLLHPRRHPMQRHQLLAAGAAFGLAGPATGAARGRAGTRGRRTPPGQRPSGGRRSLGGPDGPTASGRETERRSWGRILTGKRAVRPGLRASDCTDKDVGSIGTLTSDQLCLRRISARSPMRSPPR